VSDKEHSVFVRNLGQSAVNDSNGFGLVGSLSTTEGWESGKREAIIRKKFIGQKF
jgi:hypothetical protein